MELSNVHELMVVCLKDLYSAENQLTKALPLMAEAATSATLKKGFEDHLKLTEEHVRRLEKIGENLNIKLGGHACKAMQGLIEEGNELIKMGGEPSVVDAALIGAAQKVEHYEIAAYGTVFTLATAMGHTEEADLLQQTLQEEEETDKKLTVVAEEEINPKVLRTVEGMDM